MADPEILTGCLPQVTHVFRLDRQVPGQGLPAHRIIVSLQSKPLAAFLNGQFLVSGSDHCCAFVIF